MVGDFSVGQRSVKMAEMFFAYCGLCFILMQILTVCFFNFWCIVSVYLVTNETPSSKDLQPIYKRTNFTFH